MFSKRPRQWPLGQASVAFFLVALWYLNSCISPFANLRSFPRVRGFTSVCFVDDRHGWIAGTKGVLWTQNRGESWKSQRVIIAKAVGEAVFWPIDRAGKILWADPSRALITSDDGLVICHAGAESVRKILPQGLTVKKMEDLAFTSFSQGWATAGGEVLRTVDGGRTWQRVMKSPGEGYVSLAARNSSVWALGYEGQFSWTSDGGVTWKHTRLERKRDYCERVKFLNERQGWLFTARRTLRTDNGGLSWSQIPLPLQEYSQVYAIDFADSQRGWIVGLGSIWATEDGGLRWTVKLLNIQDYIVDVSAVPNGGAWAVGRQGTVFRTEYRGHAWLDWFLRLD